ncbi:unnamed protein product, partial [Prorocentrum cordatum]
DRADRTPAIPSETSQKLPPSIPAAAGAAARDWRPELHCHPSPAANVPMDALGAWARHSSDPVHSMALGLSPGEAAGTTRMKRAATASEGVGSVTTRRGRLATRAPVQSSDLEVSDHLGKLLNIGSELFEATDDGEANPKVGNVGTSALGQHGSNTPSKASDVSTSRSGMRRVLSGISLMPRLKGKPLRSPKRADKALDGLKEASSKASGSQHAGVLGKRQHELDVTFDTSYDVYVLEEKRVRVRPMEDNVFHHRPMADAVSSTTISDASSDHSASSTGSKASLRGGRSGRSDPSALAPPEAFASIALSQVSLSQTAKGQQVIATWGVFVGKLLHSRVLCFGDVANETLHKKRYGTVKTSVLGSVRQRARLVVEQAVKMAKFVGTEQEDKQDCEWQTGDSTLKKLFSDQYVDTLALLANGARKICTVQPALARATVPARVFGDIHGQLRDLLLFFWAYGTPYEHNAPSVVFNGDFVDRGAHQLEVVGLLLALKCLLPEKVWLVRGNHEDRSMNRKYGFADECSRRLGAEMGPKLFDIFHSAFDYLPVACLIQGSVLVVHGGIGDGNWKLSDLQAVKRPLREADLADPQNVWLFNLLWSDPIEDDDKRSNVFGVHSSPRGGMTMNFGWNVTKTFCARNGLSLIVRSHQSKRGSLGFDIMHENLLVRVFTARDYEGQGNDGAVLLIDEEERTDGAAQQQLVVRPQVLQSLRRASKPPARPDGKKPSWTSDGSERRPSKGARQPGETAPDSH